MLEGRQEKSRVRGEMGEEEGLEGRWGRRRFRGERREEE